MSVLNFDLELMLKAILGDLDSFKGWSSVFRFTNITVMGDSALYVDKIRSAMWNF